ncbi:dihydrofolate reductase family protein, partial [Oceanibaculum nanhaiense]|uniref:dihydrofolate reductase family protein n=1 Tax=Oceanibaculum nanhaiense TaxID=1909734 RepID=UPI00396D87B6
FNSEMEGTEGLNTWIKIDFQEEEIPQVLTVLYRHKILSVIVEGGKKLIESFTDSGLWDEMHVFNGNKFFNGGVKAPSADGKLIAEERLDSDTLKIFR